MEATSVESSLSPPAQLFRSSKRRKVYRRRGSSSDQDEVDHAAEPASQRQRSTSPSLDIEGDVPSAAHEEKVSEIIRQRKLLHRRKAGVEFTSSIPTVPGEVALIKSDGRSKDRESDVADESRSGYDRFAPQMGHVKEDMDKHMMAFIDSELARRYHQTVPSRDATSPGGAELLSPDGSGGPQSVRPRQPATAGKLHEVDLGTDSKEHNIARTQAAISGDQPDEPEVPTRRPRVRIGRDGKPYLYRPRPRPRRNSTDLARDELVDRLLHETHMQVYDEPDSSAGAAGADGGEGGEAGGEDTAADDRIAEQFRRDFMDAISLRRERARKMHQTNSNKKAGTGAGAVDDKPRGPKLGGSRSARAAMREKAERDARAANK